MGILSGLRGNLVGPSWEFGRAFVGIWSGLRGNLVGPSWKFGRVFVEIWSGLRGNMVKPSWSKPGAPGVLRNMVRGWGGDYTDDTCCFGWMAGVTRRDVLKAETKYSYVVGTEGRVGIFPIRDVNGSDSKHDLEMLNPEP